MSIERYDPVVINLDRVSMQEDDHGEYVTYADHLARIAELEGELSNADAHCNMLRSERDALRRAITRWEQADRDYTAAQIANIGTRVKYAAGELDDAERALRDAIRKEQPDGTD